MMMMMIEWAKRIWGSELPSLFCARIKMHILLCRCINVDVFYIIFSQLNREGETLEIYGN